MLLITVALLIIPFCKGYNLEPRHSDIIEDPRLQQDSYFGYALAFWKRSGKEQKTWLLVGAPRAELEGFDGERVKQPGTVYKCDLNQEVKPRCHPVPFLVKEYKKIQDLEWRGKEDNMPARAWTGMTITVEDKMDGAVAVCAPRMKRRHSDSWYTIPGVCYAWYDEKNFTLQARLSDEIQEVGMSAHFVKGCSGLQLIVSATRGYSSMLGVWNVSRNPSFEELNIKQHKREPLSYIGYSSTSARLHRNSEWVSYVAGAPRETSNNLFNNGVVHVMDTDKWNIKKTLKGEQMGEYFGASVVALDLDFDGTDNLLLVGAPLYIRKDIADTTDQGRVYIFINKGEAILHKSPAYLSGSGASGARFGSSIAIIGDLNKDGYNDVAVGAPYEESGAVYIYHGQKGNLRSQHSQKIFGSEISPYLLGFGISIASGVDVDDNSFNDIAVGSFINSSTVIIKSYPVIHFKGASLIPNVTLLNTEPSDFFVNACLQYSTKAKKLYNINADMKVTVDSSLGRAVFIVEGQPQDHEQQMQVRLQRGKLACKSLVFRLKDDRVNQVIQPVELSMEYKISDKPADEDFCKMCPVTDPGSSKSVHIKIPFANHCKATSVCLADLKLVAWTSKNGQDLVLGEDKTMQLNVTVTNTGEPAYSSVMSLSLTQGVKLQMLPQNCYQKDNIKCSLGNIVPAEENSIPHNVTASFLFDVSGVSLGTPQLNFSLSVLSSSQEQTPIDNSLSLSVNIRLVSEVDIIGSTISSDVILPSKIENGSSLLPVIHRYEIINYGPSPVTVDLKFFVPIVITQDSEESAILFEKQLQPNVTYGDQTSNCSMNYNNASLEFVDNQILVESNDTQPESFQGRPIRYMNCSGEGVKCATVICRNVLLTSDTKGEVHLELLLNRSILESLLHGIDVLQFTTTGRVDITGNYSYHVPSGYRFKTATVQTLVMGELAGEEVKPWILPLSIVLGILIMLFIMKGLSKVGFFRRGHKEKLDILKEKTVIQEEFLNVDQQGEHN